MGSVLFAGQVSLMAKLSWHPINGPSIIMTVFCWGWLQSPCAAQHCAHAAASCLASCTLTMLPCKVLEHLRAFGLRGQTRDCRRRTHLWVQRRRACAAAACHASHRGSTACGGSLQAMASVAAAVSNGPLLCFRHHCFAVAVRYGLQLSFLPLFTKALKSSWTHVLPRMTASMHNALLVCTCTCTRRAHTSARTCRHPRRNAYHVCEPTQQHAHT